VFFARGSYGDDLQNMAPFKNNQNLFDYHIPVANKSDF